MNGWYDALDRRFRLSMVVVAVGTYGSESFDIASWRDIMTGLIREDRRS